MHDDLKIFNKIYTFSFSDEQVKKILMDLLVLSGEILPVDVPDGLDPYAYCQYDSPVEVVSESSSEIAESFTLKLTFTDEDLKEYRTAYNQELDARKKSDAIKEDKTLELPNNVWTQEIETSCGKTCPVENDESEVTGLN